MILVNEDQATYSLMKCGIQLAKEVPVVFGGVNYPNWGLLKHHPNVTGFHDKIAFNENISVAKELFGEHVRLFTMLDTTYIDRQIRRDAKEQFKGHKVTGFIDNPELSPEEQSIDQPIDESALEQPNETLNEIPMDQPQMEEQQFALGGSLDGGYAKNNPFGTALYRKGWAHPFRRKPEGINPNNSIMGEATSYPIPPERQLFTMPDITGGYEQLDPMFYLRNNKRRTPPVIKGGEDEVSATKTNTPTSRKTSISPIDAEGEFNRMMDRKYNFKNLTGLDYGGNDYFIPNASKDVTLSSNPRDPQAARIDIQDVDPILTPTSVGNEDYPGDWEDKLSFLNKIMK